jgi:hypothetical protein
VLTLTLKRIGLREQIQEGKKMDHNRSEALGRPTLAINAEYPDCRFDLVWIGQSARMSTISMIGPTI